MKAPFIIHSMSRKDKVNDKKWILIHSEANNDIVEMSSYISETPMIKVLLIIQFVFTESDNFNWFCA